MMRLDWRNRLREENIKNGPDTPTCVW